MQGAVAAHVPCTFCVAVVSTIDKADRWMLDSKDSTALLPPHAHEAACFDVPLLDEMSLEDGSRSK